MKVDLIRGDAGYLLPDWSWDYPGNFSDNSLLLWVIESGKGELKADNRLYKLSRGDCFFLRMDERHIAKQDPKFQLHIPWFVFKLKDSKGNTWRPSFDILSRHRVIKRVTFITNLLENCAKALNEKPYKYTESVHWFQSALIEIFSQNSEAKTWSIYAEHENKIDKICSMIKKHPEKRYSITILAGMIHSSPDHFIRIFKTMKRVTPGEYIIRSRMKAARNLLLFSHHSIFQISEILGYNDSYFFSRQFKIFNNISPAVYRNIKNKNQT